MPTSTPTSLSLLRDSLAEAQVTVRAYDTKAQIVGVGYIFALGIVFQFDKVLPKTASIDVMKLALAWAVIIVPILLFGFVLHPSRRTAPRLANEPTAKIQHILYVEPSRHASVEGLLSATQEADPAHEIAYELMKVSKLRELKRKRFLRALFAAGLCFVVMFGSQLSRSYGLG